MNTNQAMDSVAINPESAKTCPVQGKASSAGSHNGNGSKELTAKQAEEVLDAIESIDGGPKVLKLYMEVGGVHDMLSRAILINGKAANRVSYY